MVHPLSRLRRRDDGAVAVITALLISFVFIGLSALVIDLGLARDTRRQAQNASDASALAAGNVLYINRISANIPAAVSAAKAYALTNYKVTEADWGPVNPCTDASALAVTPDAPNTCISFDNGTRPTTIRVKVPIHNVSTPFAGIWGVSSVPVSAVAQINLKAGGKANCGLCIVGQGAHNLQNGDISVSGADVAINGTLDANPQGSVIDTNGGVISLQGSTPNQGTYAPAPLQHQPAMNDPLTNMAMPDYSSLTAKANSCTDGPGIYAILKPCPGPIGMAAGLYVMTGPAHYSGQENIVATAGVTLYFTCGTPAAPRTCTPADTGTAYEGDLLMTGQGTLTITAPTSEPNKGLAIVADRNNQAVFSFRGNGTTANSGTIYLVSGTLDFRGNGAANNLNSLVVAKDFTFSGNNAAFNSVYTQSANVEIDSWDLHLSQ